jgi:hypothetical protein
MNTNELSHHDVKDSEQPPKAGDRISCSCGAGYELSYEGPSLCEKDDARCQFCRTVLTSWPQPFSLKLARHPPLRRTINGGSGS